MSLTHRDAKKKRIPTRYASKQQGASSGQACSFMALLILLCSKSLVAPQVCLLFLPGTVPTAFMTWFSHCHASLTEHPDVSSALALPCHYTLRCYKRLTLTTARSCVTEAVQQILLATKSHFLSFLQTTVCISQPLLSVVQ